MWAHYLNGELIKQYDEYEDALKDMILLYNTQGVHLELREIEED